MAKRTVKLGTDKRENFKVFGAYRTDTVLRALRTLGNCGNRSNYKPEMVEIDKIEQAIRAELERTVKVLRNGIGTGRKSGFSL